MINDNQILELSQLIELYGDQRAKLSRDLIKGRREAADSALKQLVEVRYTLQTTYGIAVY